MSEKLQLEKKAFETIKNSEFFPIEKGNVYTFDSNEFIFSEESEYYLIESNLEKKIINEEMINYTICKSLRFVNKIISWIRDFDCVNLPILSEIKKNIPKSVIYYNKIEAKNQFSKLMKKVIVFHPYISFEIFPEISSYQTCEETLTGKTVIQESYTIFWKISKIDININLNYNEYIKKRIKDYYKFVVNKLEV